MVVFSFLRKCLICLTGKEVAQGKEKTKSIWTVTLRTPSTPFPPKTKCAAAGVASLTEFGGVPEDHSLVKTPRYILLHSSQTQTNQDVLPD